MMSDIDLLRILDGLRAEITDLKAQHVRLMVDLTRCERLGVGLSQRVASLEGRL